MDNQNSLPIAIVLVGPSGCGKSKYAEHLARTTGVKVISNDTVRATIAQEMGGKVTEKDFIDNPYLGEISDIRLHQEIVRATKAKENIVIDASNLRPEWRASMLQYFQSPYHKVATVFQAADTHELLLHSHMRDKERMKQNQPARNVTPEFIDYQKKNFVLPTVNEGFDEVNLLTKVAAVTRRSTQGQYLN